MAYSFDEATFTAAVKLRIKNDLAGISDSQVRKSVEALVLGLVEIISDEFEIVDQT